ncbi:hypothetical protein ACHHYP_00624 [Achlya hypogyna]|uniref:Exonuclease domain-containing protein n=1 Tax=Achlya hypogyna TaxID=1202772 RepID=A0A1V9ZUH7_ACHHY|nr:hypothetical protein ACHHYP_00624 [Achlya hypogyna]
MAGTTLKRPAGAAGQPAKKAKKLSRPADATALPGKKTKEAAVPRTYEALRDLTQQNRRFNDFYEKMAKPDWVSTATMKRSSKAQYKRIVALDCEMCVTFDPSTETRNSKALVRVTLVDGEDPETILVDLIVHQPQPGHSVLLYKTDIHGIAPDLITNSKIDPARARKELLKHVGPDTIVVGHSLYGDLASLFLKHTNVIDTSFLFLRKDVPQIAQTPGLKDLTNQLLAFPMPDIHDSYLDAKMTMLVAKHALTCELGAVIEYDNAKASRRDDKTVAKSKLVPGVAIKAVDPSKVQDCDSDASRWKVHRIPKGIFNSDLEQFIITKTSVVPALVENLVFKTPKGSTVVHFASAAHAQLAFAMLEGVETKDPLNRPVKALNVSDAKGITYKGIKFMLAEKPSQPSSSN